MSKKVKFRIGRGLGRLMRGDTMCGILREQGEQIATECGEGYESVLRFGKNRAVVFVRAESDSAVRDNYQNNTLIKRGL